MGIDNYARWLSRATLAVAIIMIGWGLSVVLSQPATAWFTASATICMALLLLSVFWHLRGSFIAIAALALATAVVSRLFLGWFLGALVFVQFVLRAASVAASADSREASLNSLTLISSESMSA